MIISLLCSALHKDIPYTEIPNLKTRQIFSWHDLSSRLCWILVQLQTFFISVLFFSCHKTRSKSDETDSIQSNVVPRRFKKEKVAEGWGRLWLRRNYRWRDMEKTGEGEFCEGWSKGPFNTLRYSSSTLYATQTFNSTWSFAEEENWQGCFKPLPLSEGIHLLWLWHRFLFFGYLLGHVMYRDRW